MDSRETLKTHYAYVAGDNQWQARARLMQSLWRQEQGLEAGLHLGEPLGSRVTLDAGNPPEPVNYTSEAAKIQVQKAVDGATTTGALLSRPRLWVDLLSSQPLCFNLFGPLAEDLDLATSALQLVWPQIRLVTDIRFEWSPGRNDARYTGNRSAFDVVVDYEGKAGRGFVGIEIKYHEDLSGSPASDPDGRYPEIARSHGIFREGSLPELQKLPLQQLWLDHLLALQLAVSPCDGWDEGAFVLLSPIGNVRCTTAADRYRRCLTDATTFDARRLEEVVHAIRLAGAGAWIDEVDARYFDPRSVTSAVPSTA